MNIQQISKNCIAVFLEPDDINLKGDIMTSATRLALELLEYRVGSKVEVESYKSDRGVMLFVTLGRVSGEQIRVFKFENCDNLITAARLIIKRDKQPTCDLYFCNQTYYLVLHKAVQAECLLVLHEFAESLPESCHAYMYLKDYGQMLVQDCAIEKLCNA